MGNCECVRYYTWHTKGVHFKYQGKLVRDRPLMVPKVIIFRQSSTGSEFTVSMHLRTETGLQAWGCSLKVGGPTQTIIIGSTQIASVSYTPSSSPTDGECAGLYCYHLANKYRINIRSPSGMKSENHQGWYITCWDINNVGPQHQRRQQTYLE